MTEYQALFKRVAAVTENDHNEIARLYLSYFDGSDEERVISDLEDKTEVLLLYYQKSLVGFTTLQLYDFEWQDSLIQIIYSGDTVVHHAHWGQQALAFAWIANLGKLKRERPDVPLYWFAIFKGHRTYKFLPAFSKSFYPYWSIDRSDLKPLADAIALEKFGSAYSPRTGIVKFDESRGHLNPGFDLQGDAFFDYQVADHTHRITFPHGVLRDRTGDFEGGSLSKIAGDSAGIDSIPAGWCAADCCSRVSRGEGLASVTISR